MLNNIHAIFDELLPIAFGPEFYAKLIEIARELQVDIDLDAVERGQAKALEIVRAIPAIAEIPEVTSNNGG